MSELQEDGAELPPFLPMETLLHLAERSADQAGITLTRIRRHVYRMLLDADEPLGAYEIVDRLEGVGSAKPATAYRALSCLEVLGLVRKIKSLSKYVALRTGPSEAPLAFVVCRDCGTAEQIPIDETSKTLFANALACGFQDLDATIEITGRCKGHDDAQTG